jgi:hypothetical protein
MDLNGIGIGAVFGAIFMGTIQLYMFASNRKKDELKNRIEKLYSPLYVYYLDNMKFTTVGNDLELYTHYLALKQIYIANSIYASDILKELFENMVHVESDLMNQTLENRVRQMSNEKIFRNDKGKEADLNDMLYRIVGWIDREHDELQLYYAKGLIGRFLWRLEVNNNPAYARETIPAGRSFN